MNATTYDYIIVGAGISGLYAFEKLKNNYNVLILEASNRIGGRMGEDLFYGTNVAIGAGIGRKSKDELLQKLLKKHKIKTHEFQIHKLWLTQMQEDESTEIVKLLKHNYNKQKDENSTFKEYAIRKLGKERYHEFIKHYEYTDMEKADAYETLFHYGLEDNKNGWTGISVPWNDLLEKMTPPETHIKYNCQVNSIERAANEKWLINNKYLSNNVILATTINVVKELLPQHRQIYKYISGQPFMRIYGKFTPENALLMPKTSVIVNNQIKRIIPISKTVFMIVYSDNANAEYMKHKITGNNPESREWLCRKIEHALHLPAEILTLTAIKIYYWKIGTHYCKPGINFESWIEHAQNPEPGLYVVGEMISQNQGWTEGALESVERVIQ